MNAPIDLAGVLTDVLHDGLAEFTLMKGRPPTLKEAQTLANAITLLSRVLCLNPFASLDDISVEPFDGDDSMAVLCIRFDNGKTYRFGLCGDVPVTNAPMH
ncbi:hypothetical protein [Paraburkholderia flagellata]|uniref:hypothetical protein n=1 Tax=Paraburkholderia flagellata TaxID=2883241 RepID=UPI001F45951F|nr:hypothetical protein [Paraburkholderia flagellata]